MNGHKLKEFRYRNFENIKPSKTTHNNMNTSTIKSPFINNMPKYYERKLKKGQPRFENVQYQEAKAQLLMRQGNKLKNPFETSKDKEVSVKEHTSNITDQNVMDHSQNNNVSITKVNGGVGKKIRTNSKLTVENPMDSGMNPASNRMLPRLMSPIERNQADRKPMINMKSGYSRKVLVMRRNLKSSFNSEGR